MRLIGDESLYVPAQSDADLIAESDRRIAAAVAATLARRARDREIRDELRRRRATGKARSHAQRLAHPSTGEKV